MISDDLLRRLCRARETLRETDGRLSLSAIAAQAGLSRSHFMALYAGAFGDTPHQTRIAARLARARELLAERDCTVTQACLAAGFSSLGSFSTLFSRRYGVTPSEARRQFRDGQTAWAPHCMTLMNEALAR